MTPDLNLGWFVVIVSIDACGCDVIVTLCFVGCDCRGDFEDGVWVAVMVDGGFDVLEIVLFRVCCGGVIKCIIDWSLCR